MRSEHEPLGGADLTCPRCKYMTVRWLSDLQIYSCFRLGCGWEGVDPTNPAPLATQMRQQHEREMAALRAEIHELADALLRVTGGMQEIAAVLQVPNDVPVIDCVIKALAERDELQANDGGLDCGHCRLQPTCESEFFVGCQQVAALADAFGVPQT
jgi:hypothetical protein